MRALSDRIPRSVQSDRVTYRSRTGMKLVAYWDRVVEGRHERAPYVLMAPKYAECKKNNLQIAYYLAVNGFNVLRFDHACHVGESEGVMSLFTLGDAVEDILGSLDFIEEHLGSNEVILFSASLSGRCSFRAAAMDRRIVKLVSLVGVLNIQYTLYQIYKEDLVGGHIAGKRWGVNDILGFDIDLDHLFDRMVKDEMHDLEGTRKDLSRAQCPIVYLGAERDAWVDSEDVDRLLRHRKNTFVHVIKNALHEVRENPQAARETIKLVVHACLGNEDQAVLDDPILAPDKKMLIAQNRLEREQLKSAQPEEEPESSFWTNYLSKYSILERFEDYQEYLDLLGGLLGEIHSDDMLLDAGCGNGLFGMWVIRDLIEQNRQDGAISPPMYLAIDLTQTGLAEACRRHVDLGYASGFKSKSTRNPLLDLAYAQVDLEECSRKDTRRRGKLPFDDNCFDKVCCSLVISYLRNPGLVIRELARVLAPGGRIVVSSMKPYCDMSSIYRDFLHQEVENEELESARDLLRAAGRIKVKEEKGYYRFFSGDAMAAMAKRAGLKKVDVHSSFGDQTHLIAAEK